MIGLTNTFGSMLSVSNNEWGEKEKRKRGEEMKKEMEDKEPKEEKKKLISKSSTLIRNTIP